MVFTAGGNGSGKTSGLHPRAAVRKYAQIIFDSTLSNYEHGASLIERALNAQKRAVIVLTWRPIEGALAGVLERARTKGRTVAISTLMKTHRGVVESFRALRGHYRHHERVGFAVIDNSRSKREARRGDINAIGTPDYDGIKTKLCGMLESEYARGRVSDEVYRHTRGSVD